MANKNLYKNDRNLVNIKERELENVLL